MFEWSLLPAVTIYYLICLCCEIRVTAVPPPPPPPHTHTHTHTHTQITMATDKGVMALSYNLIVVIKFTVDKLCRYDIAILTQTPDSLGTRLYRLKLVARE